MKKPNLYGCCSYFLFSHFIYKGAYNLSGRCRSGAPPNPIYGNFWQPNIGFLKIELIYLALSILSEEQEKLTLANEAERICEHAPGWPQNPEEGGGLDSGSYSQE